MTAAAARDMPLYLFKNATAFSAAIERHVVDTLQRGLYGWRVTDCVVTLTDCGYSVADGPPSRRGPTSTSYDYRQLTPIVLRPGSAARPDGGLRAGAPGGGRDPERRHGSGPARRHPVGRGGGVSDDR